MWNAELIKLRSLAIIAIRNRYEWKESLNWRKKITFVDDY